MKTKPLVAAFLGFMLVTAASAPRGMVKGQSPGADPASPAIPTSVPIHFGAFTSPILFKGDAVTAYRDPAAIYNQGMFHL